MYIYINILSIVGFKSFVGFRRPWQFRFKFSVGFCRGLPFRALLRPGVPRRALLC